MVTKEGERVTVLWLCEQNGLILKPHTLYQFEIDPHCAKCKEIAEICKPTGEK